MQEDKPSASNPSAIDDSNLGIRRLMLQNVCNGAPKVEGKSICYTDASPASARNRQVIPCAWYRGRIPWG